MSLDLFTFPLTDVTIQGYREVTCSLGSTGIAPISFSIGALDDFVDLGLCYLEVEFCFNSASTNRLVGDADSASDEDDTKFVYMTNNLGHMIFKQMNVRLNGTLMSNQTDTSVYTAFMETLIEIVFEVFATTSISFCLVPRPVAQGLNVK